MSTRNSFSLEIREQYSRAGHWRPEDLWSSFAVVAARNPHATAFVDGDRQVSFGDLARMAERFGAALQRQGLRAARSWRSMGDTASSP
jgi:pyochelin biosynthesis protein PchD